MSEKEAQAEAVATTPAPASVAEEVVSAKGQDGADQPAQEPLQEREQGNSDVAVEASKTEASGDTATVLVPTQAELDQLQPGVFPDLNVRSGSGRKTRGVGARERGSVCVRVCVCACVCVCVCARARVLALLCFASCLFQALLGHPRPLDHHHLRSNTNTGAVQRGGGAETLFLEQA